MWDMQLKTAASTAAACLLACGAAFSAAPVASSAPSAPQFNASKLDAGEKAFLTDLTAATGNTGALKSLSADQVKKAVGFFRAACKTPAADRRKALSSGGLQGKLSKANQDKLAASWEKNLCKG